jgi:hypothetical protein
VTAVHLYSVQSEVAMLGHGQRIEWILQFVPSIEHYILRSSIGAEKLHVEHEVDLIGEKSNCIGVPLGQGRA